MSGCPLSSQNPAAGSSSDQKFLFVTDQHITPNVAASPLKTGSLVQVRTRHFLVEDIDVFTGCADRTVTRLACLDDDAQGEQLEVVWESEADAKVIGEEAWDRIGSKGFDPPNHFSAFLNALRWNCVTATQPRLFQSPFRAGN
jgi:hypothetical protein